jgi:hypothetical protein
MAVIWGMKGLGKRLLHISAGLLWVWSLSAQNQPDSTLRPWALHASGWQALVGYSYQKGHYAELGLGRNIYGANIEPYFASITAGSEFYLSDGFTFAPKVSARMAGGVELGLNLLNYTDLKNNCVVLRPEVGGGFFFFAFGYGYNFRLSNTSYAIPAHHVFFIVFNIFRSRI